MKIPFEPEIYGISINVHLILEYLAFFIAFRYYVYLRKRSIDIISNQNRLSIILGAVVGAFLGSRMMGYLENPIVKFTSDNIILLLDAKTIMGGLFGGLAGVELAKKMIGETSSSGDLFTLPIILGIFIGRIGCFLSGVNEFTYGVETTFFAGMDLGDGILRHPISLYELFFLTILFFVFRKMIKDKIGANGEVFKLFMISYFAFRFMIEFIKPTTFLILGLSSIQWLCIICLIYYYKTLIKITLYAYKRLHLLRLHN